MALQWQNSGIIVVQGEMLAIFLQQCFCFSVNDRGKCCPFSCKMFFWKCLHLSIFLSTTQDEMCPFFTKNFDIFRFASFQLFKVKQGEMLPILVREFLGGHFTSAIFDVNQGETLPIFFMEFFVAVSPLQFSMSSRAKCWP